jgi:hypothetical protein
MGDHQQKHGYPPTSTLEIAHGIKSTNGTRDGSGRRMHSWWSTLANFGFPKEPDRSSPIISGSTMNVTSEHVLARRVIKVKKKDSPTVG